MKKKGVECIELLENLNNKVELMKESDKEGKDNVVEYEKVNSFLHLLYYFIDTRCYGGKKIGRIFQKTLNFFLISEAS